MLCAMLIFDGPVFPASLSVLSPWLDQTIRPFDAVRAVYAAQPHRRFIKTHTPLDGLPMRDDVTYVVVGRDPRDAMISMEHHMANMDLERVVALRGEAMGNDDLDTLPERPPASDDPTERFHTFMRAQPGTGVFSLAGVLHHLDTGGSAAGSVDISFVERCSAGRMFRCRRSFRRSSSVMWSRSRVVVI
jgi:hypothetical protein